MELDLSGIDLFDADKITFDKRKTYIYGPNGTGKTTISNQIKKFLDIKNEVNDIILQKSYNLTNYER